MKWSFCPPNELNKWHRQHWRGVSAAKAILLTILGSFLTAIPAGADEELPVLRVDGVVYNNVTVTTVTPTSIVFMYSGGMASVKLEDLDPEMQKHFHFDAAKARAAQKEQAEANAQFQAHAHNSLQDTPAGPALEGLPFQAVPVVTGETRLRIKIREEAAALIHTGDFEKLEALARGYRQSRETFPDGTWLLGEFYAGLQTGDNYTDASWESRIGTLNAWTNAHPESITARVALADEMVAYGWQARGDGYINSASREGFRLFVTRAQQGIMISEQAATMAEHCPFTPIPRLIAARGISGREEKFFGPLVSGIAANPDFINYYVEGATYELPRWHGMSAHTAEAFVQRYADKLGGEPGDVLYARVAWNMQRSGMFADVMKECGFSWTRVDRGFQALEKRYPDSLSVKSAHALLGGFAGGREVARALIDKLNGQVDESVWSPIAQFKEHVRFAYAQKK